MPSLSNRRAVAALVATGALLLTSFAVASAAEASTLYACVKKGGTAHVFRKKPKCKKGESRLSWNSEGPAGKSGANGASGTNGTNGVNGANGANGTVAAYYASGEARSRLTSNGEEVTVGSKSVPAGDYLVTAKVLVGAEGTAPGAIGVKCVLADGTTLDADYFDAGLGQYGLAYYALAPQTLVGVLKSSSPSSIEIVCDWYYNEGSARIETDGWSIGAVQASSIG